jgi:hypothetical protein
VAQLRFTTTITKAGTRVVVIVPFDPNEAWGKKDRHYVAGSINGCQIRARLENNANGWFFSIGPAWRSHNGLDVGAKVEVELLPEGPQSELLAPDIAAALDAEPSAKVFFDGLASFYRKNFVRWIESAKRPETRSARVAEMVRMLKAGRRQK